MSDEKNCEHEERVPCLDAEYCSLVKVIEKVRKQKRYAKIEIEIRNHEIIHADIKTTESQRVPLKI